MPNVSSVEVLEKSAHITVANFTLRLPLGKVKKYRLRLQFSDGNNNDVIEWRKVDWPGLSRSETIVDTSGYWRLTPYRGRKQQTLALYHACTDTGPVPIGLGWIVDILKKNSLPETLIRTRERVTGDK